MEEFNLIMILISFIVGLISGMLMLTYIPRLTQETAWFTVESKWEANVVEIFGKRPGFRVDKFLSETMNKDIAEEKIFVHFELIKWFDFENNYAGSFLKGVLSDLHRHNLKEIDSGVY